MVRKFPLFLGITLIVLGLLPYFGVNVNQIPAGIFTLNIVMLIAGSTFFLYGILMPKKV